MARDGQHLNASQAAGQVSDQAQQQEQRAAPDPPVWSFSDFFGFAESGAFRNNSSTLLIVLMCQAYSQCR
jgi:hypothetical protein